MKSRRRGGYGKKREVRGWSERVYRRRVRQWKGWSGWG